MFCRRFVVSLLLPLAAFAQTPSRPSIDFQGRLLVVASDGDMQASAYTGSPLGQPTPDLLSVIRLDRPLDGASPSTVGVPNSVVGPPASMAISPDGRYVLVAETRGPHPADAPGAVLKDLPPGRAITVVSLVDPDRPVVAQRIEGPANPIGVAFRRDGGLVAIAYDTAKTNGPPLVLYHFDAGRLSDPQTPAIPDFQPGDSLKHVAFDDPMQALALVYAQRPRLTFFRLGEDQGRWILNRWGNDVPLSGTPFEVRFTPDGRFALVNDMSTPDRGSDVRGRVVSIALDHKRTPSGSPEHTVVSTGRTGVQPEGLAISPDGQWAATTNLERSAFPPDDPRQGFFVSITLLRLDPASGRLARIDDFPFAGVIPEGIVFDNSSRFLAVISFDQISGRASSGSLDFWRLTGDFQDPERIVLAPTGLSIPVARGAQSLEISR